MRSIRKFKISGIINWPLPHDAQILHVHAQDGAVYMWVLADWDEPTISRRFELVGTGHAVGSSHTYVGTAHFPDLSLVLHVFEVMS